MTEPFSDPVEEAGPGHSGGTPRWVKVLGLVLLLLVALIAVLHMTGSSPVGAGGHLRLQP